MNTSNIKNFAKYDLTINKVFYRNMIIMSLCIAVGISALGFMGRYMLYSSATAMGPVMPYDYAHFRNPQVTMVFLSIFIGMLPCIFAGCTFHNLRKKQGRITELTLPANNKEKYVWHLIVSIGFGFLLTLASVLLADLFNYLLHICVFGNEYTYSMTAKMFDILSINIPEAELAQQATKFPIYSLLSSMRLLIITSSIMGTCAYIYGNSVKYHYNIIITYGIMLGASIILAIGISVIFGAAHVNVEGDKIKGMSTDEIGMMNDLTILFYCLAAAFATIAGICVWRSYKRYCNAQITTATNK